MVIKIEFVIIRSKNMRNRSGFTLIELLVVVAIIGLLATLSIVALNTARAKSRDAKRIADIRQIATALEMYYTDNGTYPVISADSYYSSWSDFEQILKPYMSKVPKDPDNGVYYHYYYSYPGGIERVFIQFQLEKENPGFSGANFLVSVGGYNVYNFIIKENSNLYN